MIELDNEADLSKELSTNDKVLVLFYATWCPYCMSFVPAFNKMVTRSFSKIVHVILDDYDNPLWDKYDIEAVPTVMYFEEGKVARRLDGQFGIGLNEKQFSVWLSKFNCQFY